MSDVAIRCEGLGKQYHIGHLKKRRATLGERVIESAKGVFRRRKREEDDTFWALRDIDFTVQRGEVIGVIGRNGAGKSTLLKVLSRITEPTEGFFEIHGRVGSLLEVGTGFHPELTGRDNTFLNGAILGMTRREIESKFDEIVAFAEVEKFIDTPVKHYSSGMYLRLAFAVAAHLEPEILLVDEVLAVGDASFQQRCMGRMSQIANQGRTIFFVSHNMSAIRRLCGSAILISGGKLAFNGDPAEAINRHLATSEYDGDDLTQITERGGHGPLRFTGIRVLDADGQPCAVGQTGQPIQIEVELSGVEEYGSKVLPFVYVYFATSSGDNLFLCSTRFAGEKPERMPENGRLRCVVPSLPLNEGHYRLELVCKDRDRIYDHVYTARTLAVVAGSTIGHIQLPHPSHGPIVVENRWSAL